MNTQHPLLHWLLASLVFALVLYTQHHSIIHYPNAFLFDSQGDAIKNYYGPVWHVQHDSSYSRFEAMNYPQGEQVTFLDAQPYISNSLKFIDRHVVPLSNQVVGILNILLILSAFLAILCLFRIFQLYGIEPIIAIALAVGIILLHPLWIRFKAHYALAYLHIIPLA